MSTNYLNRLQLKDFICFQNIIRIFHFRLIKNSKISDFIKYYNIDYQYQFTEVNELEKSNRGNFTYKKIFFWNRFKSNKNWKTSLGLDPILDQYNWKKANLYKIGSLFTNWLNFTSGLFRTRTWNWTKLVPHEHKKYIFPNKYI